MSDGNEGHEWATDPDQPRLGPTEDDNDYSLSLEQVGDIFAKAGLPRDLRTLQRYCRKGRLKARLFEFPYGERYLITPTSVERRIAYLKELRQAAVNRGERGPAAATTVDENAEPNEARQGTTSTDTPRPAAADARVIELLERENHFLKGQIAVKDEQIKAMSESSRESTLVLGTLQKMLLPLLGKGSGERIYDAKTGGEAP